MNTPIDVHWMAPGAPFTPPPAAEGVTVVGVRGQPERDTARRTVRAALRTALAAHWAVAEDLVELHSPSGDAPWALLRLAGAPRRVPLAISHDGDLSVAAFAAGNAVGVDVSQIVPVPDWEAVARDYLGPAVAQALAGVPGAARDAAFARAWSEQEARSKYFGLPLEEWSAERDARLAGCAVRPLLLPEAYAGFVALAPGTP